MQVWKLTLQRLGEQNLAFATWSHLIAWILDPSKFTPKILKLLAVHATIFFLWQERNIRLQDNVSCTPNLSFRRIDRSIRDALLARNRMLRSYLLSSWFVHEPRVSAV
ncbi:unnamed protein product [Thlaspi arvense]|uniref:Reverse transcriptase zinc-binding domain-containing protein n=1 Tax=Thlaspi arvense TaxID=13288 RepID=A0AAU9S8V3_THLAR|nr:unnamed protein product [Thlaspi arvense]